MTKTLFQRVRKRLASLRWRFLVVFAFSLAVAFGIFIGIDALTNVYIDNVYMSEERRQQRINSYLEDLQDYVNEKNITADNIDEISRWSRENRYVYLLIDGTKIFWGNSEDKDEEKENGSGTGEGGGDDTACEHTDADENSVCDECGEKITTDGTGGEEDGTGNGGSQGGNTGSGITVTYPTLEELFKLAQESGGLPLKLAKAPESEVDSVVSASFVDYSEFLYYDISNIASVIIAAIAVTVIMILYIRAVTNRIIKLGDAVNAVASGEVENHISADGRDEISALASNVESMRSTMVENYKKEKAALESNTELITSMSHDIRTPLTVLLGYIDVMRLHSENDEVMQGYLRAAESTAMRLKKLSDDMFGYFLVFGGKNEAVEFEKYDAATLVEQMLSEHILLMKENGYDIEVQEVGELNISDKTVSTNAACLVRIFDNAFSNINKYADKKKPIKIQVNTGACSVKVTFINYIRRDGETVESNGIGLKTCLKLAEMIGATFKTAMDEECFTLELELPVDME